MTEWEAFMWMISNAAWSDTKHCLGPIMVDVPRGSFVATLRELQSRFMWDSDKRVRTFLKGLAKNDMAVSVRVGSKNHSKTHVTICNYEEYQSRGRTKIDDNFNSQKVEKQTHEKTHDGRTQGTVKHEENYSEDVQRTHEGTHHGRRKETRKQGNKCYCYCCAGKKMNFRYEKKSSKQLDIARLE